MKEAGLAHGGFYAHFVSREAMLAEAAERAGCEAVAASTRVVATAPPEQALQWLLRAYLSKQHVKAAEMGCPVAAGIHHTHQKEITMKIKKSIALVPDAAPRRDQR